MPRLPKFGPDAIPLDVVFAEDYARTRRMIVKDFAFIGALIVVSVILGALLNVMVVARL